MAKKKEKRSNPTRQEKHALDYAAAVQEAKQTLKHLDKKVFKSVNRGMQYDSVNRTNPNNIVYPLGKIPDNLLRLIEPRNPLVGGVITLRIQQMMEFVKISHDKDIPGWEFVLKDEKEQISGDKEKQKEFLENFLECGHREDYVGIETPDNFKNIATKYTRDRLLIDKITWENETDQSGKSVALWVLDGATIFPVLPGGFYGSPSQVGGLRGYSKIEDVISKLRVESTPPPEEIRFVQELLYNMGGGGVVAAFDDKDLIYDLSNELNDVRFYKQGLSVVEKANLAVTAFINSLTYNLTGLSKGSIPKVGISLGKDNSYTPEQLEDMQDEWAANFEGTDGQWNIPLLNGDAKVLNMFPSNRDMEYNEFMQFSGALVCSCMGADPAELGLRLNQAQNVLNDNQDAKQLFSKSRGLKDLLGGLADIVNKWLALSGYDFAKDFKFKFNGVETEDKSFEADLRTKNVKSVKTVNEIRKEMDLPSLGEKGDIILDPVYAQNVQMMQGMGEGGESEEEGFGGFSEDETDSLIDEALEKAVMLI